MSRSSGLIHTNKLDKTVSRRGLNAFLDGVLMVLLTALVPRESSSAHPAEIIIG